MLRDYQNQPDDEQSSNYHGNEEEQASVHGAFTELKPPNLGPVRAEASAAAGVPRPNGPAIDPAGYGGRGGTGGQNVQLEEQLPT